jgi:acyl-CoA reductase-like NAD-dependent aldehyde dehydrogenase
MVSFTGSSGVGVAIQTECARTMKRSLMELGGKGAALVLADADVSKAVTALASVWGFHSGQICTAPTRAVVHRSRLDEVTAGLRASAEHMTVGDPLDKATMVGPVISAAHRDRVEALLADSIDAGAEVLLGAERPDVASGFYVAPTLLGADNTNPGAREEFFAPVIVVVPFDDVDEGIAIARPWMTFSPTPPTPKTTAVSPGSTSAVLSTAPTPVSTPHAMRHAEVKGISSGIFTAWTSATVVSSAKLEVAAKFEAGSPR